MKTLVIDNSSAISKIEFNQEESIVGVYYTSSDKGYEFYCEDFNETFDEILKTYESGESVGKKIHSLRKEGKLETIVIGGNDEED